MTLRHAQLTDNLRNNANYIIANVDDVHVEHIIELMETALQKSDKEKVVKANSRSGSVEAMDKLFGYLPRRRGALRRFIAVLRHQDFSGNYDHLADVVEGKAPSSNNGNKPMGRLHKQPASASFPHQVSTENEEEGNLCLKNLTTDNVMEQASTGGEPCTLYLGGAGLGNGPYQVSTALSSTSSVDLSDLKRRGEVPPEEVEEEETCQWCEGCENGAHFCEKHSSLG
ncbi:uncharacterized protein LOC135494925 [Lineus longissimus]|uniref:uncharacterized protein LOC135494925 n=1 Tax=Lineus longissimus TaxID=88925 RepID=UPI002B4D8483